MCVRGGDLTWQTFTYTGKEVMNSVFLGVVQSPIQTPAGQKHKPKFSFRSAGEYGYERCRNQLDKATAEILARDNTW